MATSRSMQVFRDACDQLAGALTPHGFKYRKSKRQLFRQGTLFEHRVTFGTSRSVNSLPGHVHLEVWATAWSTALADYRKKERIKLPTNEAVLFGAPIENLFRPAPPYIWYDVGDPKERTAVLARVTAVLRTEVLRAFEIVESLAAFRKAVESKAMPCIEENASRDFFTCFGVNRRSNASE